MGSRTKILSLGLCLYFCPPLFSILAVRWFPKEFVEAENEKHQQAASILRSRFWRAVAMIALIICGVLLIQWWRRHDLNLNISDWLRIAAAFFALTATLARGGWAIQTWKNNTVVERIDRGKYLLGQLGAATLLIFVLTLWIH